MYAFCIARGCKIFLYHKLIKLLIMVKIIVAVIMITAAQASAAVYAQKATIIVNNAPLREVFKELREQTGYHFLFLMEDLEATKPVTLDLKQASLEEILARCFVNQPLTYRVRGNRVLVSRKSELTNAAEKEPVVEQQQTVTGIVTDENNQPMPGVTVSVKGSTLATSTDDQGRFQIQVPNPQAVLVFTILGYKTQEHPVVGNHVINARLIAAISDLDEVVVVGYGTMRKSDLTGSVAQIKSEDLQAVPVYNMEQALKGRAAGVQVTQNSGQPGGRIEVRVRGGNSMIGDNQPLYVVDGFPLTGGLNFLNPADIESIDILKDASATAIYGARGANGVVIITSKKGKKGLPGRVELNSYFGVQEATKRYDLMDAREYAIIANEWLKNEGQEPYFDLDEVQSPGTDWQDVVLRTAQIQDHTLTFSGASEKTQYSLSGNYYDQDGILINTGVKRGSARLNLGHDVKDWLRLNVNLNLSRREQLSVPVNNGYRGTGSVLSAAASAPPTLPVYDENGLPTQIERIYNFGSADMRNPMVFAQNETRSLGNTGVGNASLDVKLSEHLTFKTMVGLEYAYTLNDQFTPIIFDTDRGSASQQTYYRSSFLNENTLNYTKEFGDRHRLTLLGGFTYQTDRNRNFKASGSGLPGNTTRNFDLSAMETINPPTSSIEEWALASWLGRANYVLADKYLFTASVRADGSSRFGANNRWAMFPSGAFAWRLSEESFMQDVRFINDLKVRASYGVTGNTALSPYQSLDRMGAERTIYVGNEAVIGYSPSNISNADLKWESTQQTDVGFDLTIWDNRLNVTADYYWKYTTDLLASVPLPPSVGFGSVYQNIGEIKNQGIEFGVSADILTGEWKWSLSGMLSANRNEVVKLAGGSDIYSAGQGAVWSSTNIAREGKPLGSLFGYLEDGLNENGYIQYKDANGDGTVNSQDRVILGNPNPDLIYSVNSTLSYKGVNLSVFLEGVQGNQVFNATDGTHLNSFQRGSNQFRDLLGNYWTVENPDPNAKYPRLSSSSGFDISDRFIEDGSYLRLKSVNLGYDLPVANWGLTWCNALQIYVSGTNLLTFTKYTGLDPEVNTRGDDSNDVGNRLRMGHDQSSYPNARIFAMGLKLTF
ncbi:TonB-linked outer membrane protein, SusC/RagA family [Parapedobacter indicus]|uniref:TonB-linked outer membrane protein, SusC/RagA family n=2 Tax=Parapedobacter indicus TaxID=1477437 RepID=A0A1I3ETB1_9SPHI|nr:TonB-linked SusC/RagA family outer membrane protein [Parapedobacter indicus]SFI02199.1 TonB-linked outer membrane protein, SusC/RagA family [Parapedobacter indicus]